MTIANLEELKRVTLTLLDSVMKKKTNSEEVKQFCSLSHVLLQTIKLEIDYKKLSPQKLNLLEDKKI